MSESLRVHLVRVEEYMIVVTDQLRLVVEQQSDEITELKAQVALLVQAVPTQTERLASVRTNFSGPTVSFVTGCNNPDL